MSSNLTSGERTGRLRTGSQSFIPNEDDLSSIFNSFFMWNESTMPTTYQCFEVYSVFRILVEVVNRLCARASIQATRYRISRVYERRFVMCAHHNVTMTPTRRQPIVVFSWKSKVASESAMLNRVREVRSPPPHPSFKPRATPLLAATMLRSLPVRADTSSRLEA